MCGQRNLLGVPRWFDILLELEMNLHGVLNIDSLTCKYSHAVLFRGIPRYFEQYSGNMLSLHFQSFKKTLKFHNVMACLPEQGPQEPGKLRTISREGKKGEPLTLLRATWEKKLFFFKTVCNVLYFTVLVNLAGLGVSCCVQKILIVRTVIVVKQSENISVDQEWWSVTIFDNYEKCQVAIVAPVLRGRF